MLDAEGKGLSALRIEGREGEENGGGGGSSSGRRSGGAERRGSGTSVATADIEVTTCFARRFEFGGLLPGWTNAKSLFFSGLNPCVVGAIMPPPAPIIILIFWFKATPTTNRP